MSVTILGRQRPTDSEILIGNPMLEQPADGWDVLMERLWLPHATWLRRGQVREGPPPERGLFIVQDITPLEWLAGCPVVQVRSLGIALQDDGKDYKLSCSAGLTEDMSLANVPDPFPAPTIWRKQYPRVTKLWVSLTTPSIEAHVGVPGVPPDTFGIGGGAWNMAWVSATNWTATGWIGETRDIDRLPGSSACLVADSWLYDPGYDDRDGIAPGIIYL